MIDCLIIVFSAMSIYWLFHQADLLAENFPKVLLTSCIFVLLSFPGFRIFHTYSGFMRFSSFVDLMRVTYCNLVSLVLVLICMWGVEQLPVKWLNWFMPFTTRQIVLIFIISTLLMWALRIFVKTLYDQALSNTKAGSGEEHQYRATQAVRAERLYFPFRETETSHPDGRASVQYGRGYR